MGESHATTEPVRFETHPDRYKHWKLSFAGPIATLAMDVQEDGGMRPGYPLKRIGRLRGRNLFASHARTRERV